MPVENTQRETGSDQKEKAGLSQHVHGEHHAVEVPEKRKCSEISPNTA